MTCCFGDKYLIKKCKFITFWLFSKENTTIIRIWKVKACLSILICLSKSGRRQLILSGCDILHCVKAVIWNLTGCTVVNGEKFESPVTLTLFGRCPMSNTSEQLLYSTLYYVKVSSILTHYFFSYRVHRHTDRQNDRQMDRHIHTAGHEYSVAADNSQL